MSIATSRRNFIARPAFARTGVTGDFVHRQTMTAGTDLVTRELSFEDIMGNGNNIWGVAMAVTGLTSDTLKGTISFLYEESQGYIATYDFFTGKSSDFSAFYRLDDDSTVVGKMPFKKIKVTFDITGSSDTPVVNCVFVSSTFSVIV